MHQETRRGVALLPVLIILLVGCLTAGTVLLHASRSSFQTRRAIDYQKARIAAEAGLDYGVMRTRDILLQYGLKGNISRSQLQFLFDAIAAPSSPDPAYSIVTPDGESAFRITVNGDPVNAAIPAGALSGQNGIYQTFTVTCGALNEASGVGAVLQQELIATSTFMVRFGVFYEQDLEILPGATMEFAGPVHCNKDMYLGGPLQFHDRLTAAGNIYHRRKDSNDRPGEAQIRNEDGTLRSMKLPNGTFLDSSTANWGSAATQRWGENVQSQAHGVTKLAPPIEPTDVPHDLIERPLESSDPGYNEATEAEKFANKAALTLHVASDGTVTAMDRNGDAVSLPPARITPPTLVGGVPIHPKTSGGAYTFQTNGVYETSNRFYDTREQKYMAPVDIYLDELLLSYSDLYSGASNQDEDGSGVVYITRDPPPGEIINGATVQPQQCVRIRNGSEILDGWGLSIISDLPVYVEGSFNTGDTRVPAMVAGDAVTMLSNNWQDGRSTMGSSDRSPVDTTYNLVIMTGNTTTQTGNYNGGLENVLRFLENWNSRTVTYRGSIICMWTSEIATGKWFHGSRNSGNIQRFIYNAPRRNWGYDDIFRNQTPPGLPRLFGVQETVWSRADWSAFN